MPHMKDILHMDLSELGGKRFSCSCTKEHTADFKNLIVAPDAIELLSQYAMPYKEKGILLVADSHTYAAAGARARRLLEDSGFFVKEKVFKIGAHDLVPDERAVGSLLLALESDIGLIVAVGSGTLNDLSRTISARTRIPYIIVCTAPSMDGYASTVAPIIIQGHKTTIAAVAPVSIIADTKILKDAPYNMLYAGFGDVLGKLTALADWQLSAKVTGEYYCEDTVSIVRHAIKRCIDSAEGIARRDPAAIEAIMQALVLTGVSMGLVGNSRPASGAEHHFAHYWEMDALAKGQDHPLHGNSVGAATGIVAYCYQALGLVEKYSIEVPTIEELERILRYAGAAANPAELGIEKELFHRSVLHALEIRPRYTVLQYAKANGELARLANELTKRYYGS